MGFVALFDAISEWLAELIKSGNSEGDAVEMATRDIKDRTKAIRENRARVDAEFKKKHGEDL